MAAMVFAHQGGWDEILFALTPVLVVALLLLLANRRANAAKAARESAEATTAAATATGEPDTPDQRRG